MISHEKKYLFIRVYKTGTQSMADTLLEHDASSMSLHCDWRVGHRPISIDDRVCRNECLCDVRKMCLKDSRPNKGTRGSVFLRGHHSKSSWFKEKLFPKEGWDWDKYFKFCFVRNPWDRELSSYFFQERRYGASIGKVSFKDYLDQAFSRSRTYAVNNYQCEYTTDVDYIARFENYKDEVDYLLDKLGISLGDSEPKHSHKTIHKPYWEYYDDDDIKKVGDWYKKDIDMFDYKFGE